MRTDLGDGFAAYPMVGENEATGVVAAVYASLLERMPFVPSLFTSLALCPGYLVLAHEQAAGVLADEAFGSRAQQLSASVRDATTPPADQPVRETLARFVEPLSRMLLLTAGLRLALDGELGAPPAPGRAPEPRAAEPSQPAPSQSDAPAPQLYGDIRAALETPIVNSIWRALAGHGLLDTAWSALRPQVAGARPVADGLQRRAFEAARQVPWQVAATPAALDRAGVADARPGMASVLDAYAKTLPRVLALVSSSAEPG